MSKVIVPKGKENLFRTVFSRTKDYIKTVELLKKNYGVHIYLEVER